VEEDINNADKEVKIYNQLQESKQFWSDLVKEGYIDTPEEFIKPLPHMSFVQGRKNIDYLSRRYEKISKLPAYEKMEYSEDYDTIQSWSPLIMKDRQQGDIASTKRSEEHTSELQSRFDLVCRLLLEKTKK